MLSVQRSSLSDVFGCLFNCEAVLMLPNLDRSARLTDGSASVCDLFCLLIALEAEKGWSPGKEKAPLGWGEDERNRQANRAEQNRSDKSGCRQQKQKFAKM